MNAMIYVRGHRRTTTAWGRGGSHRVDLGDVLPFFERLEDRADRLVSGRSSSPRPTQARGAIAGPLRIEGLRTVNPLSTAFVEACSEVGIARNDDSTVTLKTERVFTR